MKTKLLLVLFTFLVSACNSGVQSDTSLGVLLQFEVVDELGNPIEGANLLLKSELAAITNREGVTEIDAAKSPLYRLDISAPGYFSIAQSFSESERKHLSGRFPTIRLIERKPGRVMLAFTGDVMLGRRYHQPYVDEPQHLHEASLLEDTKRLLTPIADYLLLADYASINLESPILESEPEIRAPKGIVFYSHPETLEALTWAGVDHVSLGNNHSADYLDFGLRETIEYLDESELIYSGAGMNESQALAAARTEIIEIPYNFLGYVGWPGTVVPTQVAESNLQGGAALGSMENIVRSVSEQPKSSVTVVEYHGSAEYSEGPTEQTRERLYAAIDAGADAVVGHHPHVLHGFEIYNDKLIAYSLGNFLFDQYIYETQRSALLYLWMDNDQFHSAEVVPLYINNYRPTPATGDIRDYTLRRLSYQSASSELSLGYSGGHMTVDRRQEAVSEIEDVVVPPNEVSRPLIWNQQAQSLQIEAGVSYRVGRDLWSYGDFETENQFGLSAHNWHFSNPASGISEEQSLESYSMSLLKSAGEASTSFWQKYFLRVWDENPKSVVVSIYADNPSEVQFCLEMRDADTGTADARENPEVSCLYRQQVEPGTWQQLVFDFDPPPLDYRGLRFRFDFFGQSEGSESFYIDNIKFVSWEEAGEVEAPQMLSLRQPNQYNIFEFRTTLDSDCCSVQVLNH